MTKCGTCAYLRHGSLVQTSPARETTDAFRGIDLVASKTYSAEGVVIIAIWFDHTYYVVLGESGDEQPLLDSRC